MASLLTQGITHLGVATDHVIESFRNDLWPGYKTGAGVPPELRSQFPLLEEALESLGVRVWPMVELEADDALASAAAVAADDARVGPGCSSARPTRTSPSASSASRVVQLDRRTGAVTDDDGVRERYGVGPASIPDWLALVGDSADGFPGLRGLGPPVGLGRARPITGTSTPSRTTSPTGTRICAGPCEAPAKLAARLAAERELAVLFRVLATLRVDREPARRCRRAAWHGPDAELRRHVPPPSRAVARRADGGDRASWNPVAARA